MTMPAGVMMNSSRIIDVGYLTAVTNVMVGATPYTLDVAFEDGVRGTVDL